MATARGTIISIATGSEKTITGATADDERIASWNVATSNTANAAPSPTVAHTPSRRPAAARAANGMNRNSPNPHASATPAAPAGDSTPGAVVAHTAIAHTAAAPISTGN